MRETLILLLSLHTKQLSPLLKIVVGGPLLIALWASAGGALLETFSVILVTYLLAFGWGIGLVVVTTAILTENSRPNIDSAADGLDGSLDIRAAGRTGGRQVAPALSAVRTPRSLQSFAVPAEQPHAASQAPEKIRLPLRG